MYDFGVKYKQQHDEENKTAEARPGKEGEQIDRKDRKIVRDKGVPFNQNRTAPKTGNDDEGFTFVSGIQRKRGQR